MSQALAWLDNMHIPYNNEGPDNFWNFEYKGLDLHLAKDGKDNEIGLYGTVFIQPEFDDKDETLIIGLFL